MGHIKHNWQHLVIRWHSSFLTFRGPGELGGGGWGGGRVVDLSRRQVVCGKHGGRSFVFQWHEITTTCSLSHTSHLNFMHRWSFDEGGKTRHSIRGAKKIWLCVKPSWPQHFVQMWNVHHCQIRRLVSLTVNYFMIIERRKLNGKFSLESQEALFNPNCKVSILLEDLKKRCNRNQEGDISSL